MPKLRTILLTAAFFLAIATAAVLFSKLFSPGWIDAFDHAGILLSFAWSCLGAAGFLLALIERGSVRRLVRRWVRRREFANAGVRLAILEQQVDAMVVPVSRREQPEWILRHLQPERVAFLYTEQTQKIAAKLARSFADRVEIYPPVAEIDRGGFWLDDPHNPEDSRRMALHFVDRFKRLGIHRHRIFVDTTGGTVPMSIGAFQAAEECAVSSIYVVGKGEKGGRKGLILEPSDAHEGVPQFMSDHTGGR